MMMTSLETLKSSFALDIKLFDESVSRDIGTEGCVSVAAFYLEMKMVIGKGSCDRALSESEVRELMSSALFGAGLDGKRVLVIIPDGTRTAPTRMMSRLFHESLNDRVEALDFLIALGTHQPMSEEAINRHVGATAEERATRFARINIFNHRWDEPGQLVELGEI